jgi:hypothetical protein
MSIYENDLSESGQGYFFCGQNANLRQPYYQPAMPSSYAGLQNC